MALKTIVKVSHLSNLSDARFCSGMGVELLGFGTIPGTDHYLTPAVFQEIRGWLAGPKIIAELYGITSSDQIREVTAAYAPDYMELSWDEYIAFRDYLDIPCLVHIPHFDKPLAEPKDSRIVYLIADGDATCPDIKDIPYPTLCRVSSMSQLKEKMRAGCFAGFVLGSPHQPRAGVTSYDELGEILEELEE